MAATVWLGLGTNLGDRAANFDRCLSALQSLVRLEALSPVYETEPIGYPHQPVFWNMVVRGWTEREPVALLRSIKKLEQELGRVETFRMGPRLIDIDMLLYGDLVLHTPDLVLPHPGLVDRAFVLRPLLDVDPDLSHPATGERLAGLPAAQAVAGLRKLGAAREVLRTMEGRQD
jgi:2-amino-4-hydroxy-6-hydroxymethyldihydropteridine diphosphokinase